MFGIINHTKIISDEWDVINPNGDRALIVIKFDATPFQCVVYKKDMETIPDE